MLKSIILKEFKSLKNKILRLFIVSISFWMIAYALPNVVESPLLSDKLIESIYYGGRKTNKIYYDDLKKKFNNTEDITFQEFNLIENYYSNYINHIVNEEETMHVVNDNKRNTVGTRNGNGIGAATGTGTGTYKENAKIQNKDIYNVKSDAASQNKQSSSASSRNENDEKKYFSNSLYSLYGNRTIFNMNLDDLEKLVKSAILTDSQAVIFWESLLQLKTDRARLIFGRSQHEIDNEYYLFNFIAIKTIGLIVCTLIIFLITHKIQSYLVKTYFIYNFICTTMTYFILESLYMWKYYVAASVMFVQFGFFIKYIFDSIFSILGYSFEDYDIFTNLTKTKTVTQFLIKLFISFTSTSIIGYYGLFRFQTFCNYIFFYLCLIQLIYLITFFLQYEASSIFQPLKHITLVLIGLINFCLVNFHKKISRFSNTNQYDVNKYDSFYLVSETFSFLCISYIYEFILTQATQIGHVFTEAGNEEVNIINFGDTTINASNTYTNSNTNAKLVKNHTIRERKSISLEDSLWIVALSTSTLISLVGVVNTRYLTFIFSLQYYKLMLKIFNAVYRVKIFRCVFGFIIFFLILTNHILSAKNDLALFEACNINNHTTIKFIKFVVRLLGLLFIILTIISNFEFVVIMSDKTKDSIDSDDVNNNEKIIRKVEVSTTYEKKKKKKVKTIEIQIVKEDSTPFSFLNFVYIHVDLYMNYITICLIFFFIKDVEKNIFLNVFYAILVGILIIRVKIFNVILDFFYN